MKRFILIIAFCSFTTTFAQNDTASNSFQRFFITPTVNYNIPGLGIKLNLGYNISKHFSIMLSSGYMTSFTKPYSYVQQTAWDYTLKDYTKTIYSNAEQNHRFIPINLGLRYKLNVFGIQAYAMYQLGWNFLLNEGNYDVTIETKYINSGQTIKSLTGKANDLYYYPKTASSQGSLIGVGVLVPFTNSIQIDISYSYSIIHYGAMGIQSLGVGLNYNIK